jgi:hypothetical protein
MTPDNTRQPVNFKNSGNTIPADQSLLLNTKGLFVRNAKQTETNQAIQLQSVAESAATLYSGKYTA